MGAAARAELPASGIFAFPGGAKPGTCLHKILEKLDFPQWDQPATADLVREQLRVHGLPEAEFAEVIVEMLGKVMTAPLDERVPGLTLEKLTPAQCLHELEFYFPLQRIAPQMIGSCSREHRLLRESARTCSTSGRAHREPEGLSFAPVQGMLKGFIDLVFEFQGRFYLVDWKSNLLGSRVEDYGAAALEGEIRRRHYYFQYQFYTVALDRYLRLRLPGYRYEQHFGGVYYLFLRGIDPARPQFGIHRDRLSEPLVRALGRLLIGDAGEEDAERMDEIHQLIGSSAFSDLDRHFATFIEAQAGGERPSLALAAALVSHWRSEGHICLDLAEIAGRGFPDKPVEGVEPVQLPSLKTLGAGTAEFAGRRVTRGVQAADSRCAASPLPAPLLGIRTEPGLGDPEARRREAERIEQRGAGPEAAGPAAGGVGGSLNWQCVAAVAAVRQKFCVISGGPGTGKTHTLVLILALLLELERDRKLRIAVAAPTGKAATRIQDSIRSAKATLGMQRGDQGPTA